MPEALSKATTARLLNVLLGSSTSCRAEARQPLLSNRVSERTLQKFCRINCMSRRRWLAVRADGVLRRCCRTLDHAGSREGGEGPPP